MPRVARIVIPGCPHHITQRGNNRQDVFFVDEDRDAYLGMLGEQAERFGLRVEAYCLMGNHVHLVATPRQVDSLAKAIGRTHWLYTQYVNRLHGRSGHLWQNRFYSCAMDAEHYWRAVAYVERNPVRARLVRKSWRWVWSSAGAHCGGKDPSGLLDLSAWWRHQTASAWREVLTMGDETESSAPIREGLTRGRPLGSDAWIARLEARLGRRLRPLPVGRPKKAKNAKKGREK